MGNGETTSNSLYTKGSTNLAQTVATGHEAVQRDDGNVE